MRLRRALSNPSQLAVVEKAAQARSQLTTQASQRSRPPVTRLRQGAIQEEIIAVIRDRNAPISPRQIRQAAGDRLGIDLSFDTVYSFLVQALKDDKWRIERVDYGKYVYVG